MSPTISTMAPSSYPSVSPSAVFIITTIAGTTTSTGTYSGEGGPATAATFSSPRKVVTDSIGMFLSIFSQLIFFNLLFYAGNVYFADCNINRILKVTIATGIVSTIAGTGVNGYSGDGGIASSAVLDTPSSVAVDSADNVYIGDQNNNRIRKVTVSTGIINTIAGTGATSFSDNVAATSGTLRTPFCVALDSSGTNHMYSLLVHGLITR